MAIIMIGDICFAGPGAEEEARQWHIADALKENPNDQWALRERFSDAGAALEQNEIGGELSLIAESIRDHMALSFPFLKPAL